MTEYQVYTLKNGIRLAHKAVNHTKIVHCGIMLDIGSRDENPTQIGLAHFWEHMAFKGTQKRKSFHIINRLESVGGELNAYTTKEKICFYASLLDLHFEKAIDILSDITFHSIFPERQLEKERSVILEEMSMYLDSPEDAIQDEFDELIYPNHPLGANILGTKETLHSFRKDDLQKFIEENIDTERIILSVVGNISFKKAIKMAEKYLGEIPHRRRKTIRLAAPAYLPKTVTQIKPISQAHVAVGFPAYAQQHHNRFKYFTLIHLLGGPGMNTRLNIALREKNGLVYGIDASYTAFTDTGYTGIYYATDQKNLHRAAGLIKKEIELLRQKPLGDLQLKNLKDQLMGQLAMSDESNQGFMLMMAKSILDMERVETLEEVFANIRAIQSSDLQELAIETLDMNLASSLIYLPEEED